MIIVVTGWFDKYDRFGNKTGEKEFTASHGIDIDDNDRYVILSCEHPSRLGAIFDVDLNELVIL